MVIAKIVAQGTGRLVGDAIEAFSQSFPSVQGAPSVGILMWLNSHYGVTAEELARAMWLRGGEGAAKLEADANTRTVTISSYTSKRKLVLSKMEDDRYQVVADLMSAPSGDSGCAIGPFAHFALESWDSRCSESVVSVTAGEVRSDEEGNFIGYDLKEHEGNEYLLIINLVIYPFS